MRKFSLLFFLIVALVCLNTGFSFAAVLGAFPGPDSSPDGLELTEFKITSPKAAPVAGNSVHVSFKLKNVTDHDIKFDATGVFTGARWNSETDANNRDFGHTHKRKLLKPGNKISFSASRKLDAAGTWRFWPAYQIAGHWGPFRWHEIVVQVGEAARPDKLLGECSDMKKGSPDGLKLTYFKVRGPEPTKVGDKLSVKYTLKNMTDKPLTFVPHGIFVGARLNSTTDANNRDFGHQKKGKSILPGGIMNLEAKMILDAAGTWRFWPAYMVENHYGPFRWCEIAIEVAGDTTNKMQERR